MARTAKSTAHETALLTAPVIEGRTRPGEYRQSDGVVRSKHGDFDQVDGGDMGAIKSEDGDEAMDERLPIAAGL